MQLTEEEKELLLLDMNNTNGIKPDESSASG
jgi:hypothetical protein